MLRTWTSEVHVAAVAVIATRLALSLPEGLAGVAASGTASGSLSVDLVSRLNLFHIFVQHIPAAPPAAPVAAAGNSDG